MRYCVGVFAAFWGGDRHIRSSVGVTLNAW